MDNPKITPSFLSQYFYILRGRRRQFAGMIGLFFVTSIMDLLGISLIGPFIALVTGQTNLSRFAFVKHWLDVMGGLKNFTIWFGLGLAIVYVAKNFMAYKIFAHTLRFGFRVRSDISTRLARAYMSMPYSFYLNRNSASLVQSVINDTKSMSDDLLIPSLRMVSDSVVVIMIFLLLCWIDLRDVLISLAMVGGSLLVYTVFVRPRARMCGTLVNTAFEQIIKRVTQAFWSVKEIRILGVEDFFLEQMSAEIKSNGIASASYFSMIAIPRYMMETVVVMLVIILSLISVLGDGGQQSVVPSLATFAAAGLRILPALVSISGAAASIYYSTHALNNVYRDLHAVGEHGSFARVVMAKSDQPFQELSFDHVFFRYEGAERDALSDISLSIRRGQSVGIIGTTGAGKSTLIDAILGFHDIRQGKMRVDGLDIQQYGWDRWRNRVAYLPQSVAMLDDTIEANIAFGIPAEMIDQAKIRRAVNAAQLSNLIGALPLGLRTIIGDRGARLSGGEKQRIALARGFYFDRDVFVMDEATSSLDPETERQVIKVIESLHGQKTLIVIAHRMSTVRNCDFIYRLEDGRIAASGSFEVAVGNVTTPS